MPSLLKTPVHLGLGATAVAQPDFTGLEWYAAYAARTAADGAEGRLVSFYDFTTGWDMWEMHPAGEELVICTAGRMVLHQEIDGTVNSVTLERGDYAVNARGIWHTADVPDGTASALFITAGIGTEHRPR